jgi:serine/threonine protein kinase
MISAFGYLHERKIVHRDVKTANMLVDGKANLLVCDFGLAHQFKSDDEWLTKTCGTPSTWAPEVIKKEKYRMMPDWWSVGIILYEMMCKRKPFDLPKMENKDSMEAKKWAEEQSR